MQKGKEKAAAGAKRPVKETYPHFRYYKKSGHPTLITAEYSEKEYKYRKVMHSEREGRHLNEKVFPNPNPNDENQCTLFIVCDTIKRSISVSAYHGEIRKKRRGKTSPCGAQRVLA